MSGRIKNRQHKIEETRMNLIAREAIFLSALEEWAKWQDPGDVHWDRFPITSLAHISEKINELEKLGVELDEQMIQFRLHVNPQFTTVVV